MCSRLKVFAIALCFMVSSTLTAFTNGVDEVEGASLAAASSGGYHYSFTDPNHMSDEDFFGVYDSVGDVWTNKGKFDYDGFSAMQPIKEAVMSGDYALAKAEYRKYYINKVKTYNITVPTATKAGAVISKMLENQMMYNNQSVTPCDVFTLGNSEETVFIDVKDIVNAVKAQTIKQSTFILVGLKKDGSSAEFYSREAADVGKRPAIRVTVNGVTRRIEAAGDTYISGGTNENINYGNEHVLKVEESTTAQNPVNAWQNAVTEAHEGFYARDRFDDENTKRTYLTFDLGKLNKEDIISDAVLELTGQNVSVSGNTGPMEIALFRNQDTSVREGSLTWARKEGGVAHEHYIFNFYGFKDPDGADTIYFARPYSAIDRYNEDTFRFATFHGSVVNQYAATDDEYYGYVACKIFGDFVKVRGATPGCYRSLDVANRLISMPALLDKIVASEHMTDELFTAIVKLLWATEDYMQYTFRADGNWGTMQLNGLFSMGARFNEFYEYNRWVTAEIPSNVDGAPMPDASPNEPSQVSWRPVLSQSAVYRMRYYIKNTQSSDFGSLERAVGYIHTEFNSLLLGILATERITGVQFPFRDDEYELLRKRAVYFRDVAGPGTREIQWGDAGLNTIRYTSFFKNFTGALYEPTLHWTATGGKEGTPPSYTSILYPETKVLAMRNGWGESDYYLHTSYDNVGNHVHCDDLAPIIIAKGRYLLSDQSFGAYSSSDGNQRWLISAEAHNIIKINEEYPEGETVAGGKLEALADDYYIGSLNNWVTNNSFDFFAATKPMYKSAQFKRNIFFVKPNYWIVTDYLKPPDMSKSADYRQIWHMPPDANITVDPGSKITKSGYSDVNLQIVPVGTDSLTYDIRAGKYGGGTTTISSADYVNYMKSNVGMTTFNTILRPETPDEKAIITARPINLPDIENEGASAMAINIDTSNKKTNAVYYILNDDAQKGKRAVDGYTYNGKLFYAEQTTLGEYTAMNVYQGSELSHYGKILFKSLEEVNDIGIEYSGSVININSGGQMELSKLTIAKQANVTRVILNGERVSFKQTNNYVYFGEKPIVDDPAPPPGGGNPTPSPNHGVNSGGGTPIVSPILPLPTPSPGTDAPWLSDKNKEEIKGHWAKTEVERLLKEGIVIGDNESSLNLSGNVTRAEFVTMLLRAVNPERTDEKSHFVDVPDDSWYAEYVMSAYVNDIASGYGDYFRPNDFVTREELARILSNACGKYYELPVVAQNSYDDKDEQSPWADEAIGIVTSLGLMEGRGDNSFVPKGNASRVEAMVVLSRLLDLIQKN